MQGRGPKGRLAAAYPAHLVSIRHVYWQEQTIRGTNQEISFNAVIQIANLTIQYPSYISPRRKTTQKEKQPSYPSFMLQSGLGANGLTGCCCCCWPCPLLAM